MTYDRDTVVLYLPSIWDAAYWITPPRRKRKVSIASADWRVFEELTGSRLENACYPSDRKGATNPKAANKAWAELIDITRAWRGADLTRKERRSVLMAYGLSMSHEEIASHEDVNKSVVTRRIANAIDKFLVFLNGSLHEETTEYADEETVE